jgi:hypothetical protein
VSESTSHSALQQSQIQNAAIRAIRPIAVVLQNDNIIVSVRSWSVRFHTIPLLRKTGISTDCYECRQQGFALPLDTDDLRRNPSANCLYEAVMIFRGMVAVL